MGPGRLAAPKQVPNVKRQKAHEPLCLDSSIMCFHFCWWSHLNS